MIGRCAVDFVAVRRDQGWELSAIEINLRSGGTTHPFMALSTLTDGVYDPLAGEFERGSATSSTTSPRIISMRPATRR